MAGQGYELQAIAAVVIGGTSLFGGQGGMIGTLIGAMLIGVLNNGLVLLNVPFALIGGILKLQEKIRTETLMAPQALLEMLEADNTNQTTTQA